MKLHIKALVILGLGTFGIAVSAGTTTLLGASLQFLKTGQAAGYSSSGGQGLAISDDGSIVGGYVLDDSMHDSYWTMSSASNVLATTNSMKSIYSVSNDGKMLFGLNGNSVGVADLRSQSTTNFQTPASYLSYVSSSPYGRYMVAGDGGNSYLSENMGAFAPLEVKFDGYTERFSASRVLDDGTVYGSLTGTMQTTTKWGVGNFAVLSMINGEISYFAPISGTVNATSDGGAFIVGKGHTFTTFSSPHQPEQAYIATASGQVTYLGDLPGGENFSSAFDVSNDGLRVVGQSGVPRGGNSGPANFDKLAFLWEAERGMVSLDQIVSEAGLSLGACNLVTANAISGDGRYITGGAVCTSGPYASGYAVYSPYVLDLGSVSSVPEPANLMTILAGLGLLAATSKRRSRDVTNKIRAHWQTLRRVEVGHVHRSSAMAIGAQPRSSHGEIAAQS